ncbi:hypothetical protein ACO2I3_14600 [Leptospira interrogans]
MQAGKQLSIELWDGPLRIGVTAQELQERFPDAVGKGDDRILFVDYAKIGLPD